MRLDPNDRDRLINDQESSPIAHANVYDTGIQLPKNRQEWNIRVSPAAVSLKSLLNWDEFNQLMHPVSFM